MSIRPTKPVDFQGDPRPNPFPQPNTIPTGWDLSGLMSVYNPPELVHEDNPIPVDLGVAAELTEKYAL
ncbi:MAG TPA: hypothetical protein VGJ97_00450 [Anaerolineaceae bacterium]|jgi:hypothetical protein